MIKEILRQTDEIDAEIEKLRIRREPENSRRTDMRIAQLGERRNYLLSQARNLSPEDKVFLARLGARPHIDDFIDALFTDFFEQKGDHLYGDDQSIFGGIARFHGRPVTVLGHRKGRTMKENISRNFGMPKPEGYRKALRMMEQADKFGRPIITFVDTPGAYPGVDAEEHGQGEAIARNLAAMSRLRVPVITVVTGEGNSGGALAISVANRILMLENAVYSILSPEGFASILWKDSSRHAEAAALMKMTAADLKEAGVADEIVAEPAGGAQINPMLVYAALDEAIEKNLKELEELSSRVLIEERQKKFRAM